MKFVMIVLVGAVLVGCDNVSSRGGADGEKTVYTYTVEGKPLDCIHNGNGLSCNWDKYNKEASK